MQKGGRRKSRAQIRKIRRWTEHENKVLKKTIRKNGKGIEALFKALEGSRTRAQIKSKVQYLKSRYKFYYDIMFDEKI